KIHSEEIQEPEYSEGDERNRCPHPHGVDEPAASASGKKPRDAPRGEHRAVEHQERGWTVVGERIQLGRDDVPQSEEPSQRQPRCYAIDQTERMPEVPEIRSPATSRR